MKIFRGQRNQEKYKFIKQSGFPDKKKIRMIKFAKSLGENNCWKITKLSRLTQSIMSQDIKIVNLFVLQKDIVMYI